MAADDYHFAADISDSFETSMVGILEVGDSFYAEENL